MGLDQYCYAISREDAINDFEMKEDASRDEFAYWRKHNALQAWMENLYHSKGGTDEFNCVYVRLTKTDLEQLIEDVKQQRLKETPGFFFGSQNYYNEECMKEDIEFAHKAMARIDMGEEVYYSSWW